MHAENKSYFLSHFTKLISPFPWQHQSAIRGETTRGQAALTTLPALHTKEAEGKKGGIPASDQHVHTPNEWVSDVCLKFQQKWGWRTDHTNMWAPSQNDSAQDSFNAGVSGLEGCRLHTSAACYVAKGGSAGTEIRDGTASFNSMLKIASGWKRETTSTFLLNSSEDVVCVTGHKEITCQRSSLWG